MSCISNIPKYDKPPCAGSLGKAPNRTNQQVRRQKPCSKIWKYHTHFVHSSWHLNVSYVFADCSARSRVRTLRVLLLLLETITLPLPETSKRSHSSWWAPHCQRLDKRPPERKKPFFWTPTCAGFQKKYCGGNPKTWVECREHLSSAPNHAPCSTLPPRLGRSCRSLARVRRYPQQGCGLVEIP